MKTLKFFVAMLLIAMAATFAVSKSVLAFDLTFWMSGGTLDNNSNTAIGVAYNQLAMEIGFINDLKSDGLILDESPPDGSYTSLGTDQRTSTAGLDFLYLYDITDRLIIYGGPGIYFREISNTVQSNDTGKKYNKYQTMETEFAGSLGLKYTLAKVQLGLGYHSLRGVNGQIGFKF